MRINLQSRIDEFSYQVYTSADNKFWFRLVRERDRDIITDYFLGGFPKEKSGSLLVDCYLTLGLKPRTTIVFRDILSGRDPSDTVALRNAEQLYESAGESLLNHFGFNQVAQHTEEARGKIDLLLVAGQD